MHNVDQKLKIFQKIYELPRKESEVRVNDYNPLLLLLWKSNIDVQFMAESSLAVTTYVTGYVTKAERSSMQEILQKVSDSKSIYSCLWSFGVRALRSRECGLYEASNYLVGDHLKREVCHGDVRGREQASQEVSQAEGPQGPGGDGVHQSRERGNLKDNLLSTNYPNRPQELEEVCLYEFVAEYDWQSKDSRGNRRYWKLAKHRMVNHKIFDPSKESQREDYYYYSLLLLFVPFRNETCILGKNKTPEEAFNWFLPDSKSCSRYHSHLQEMIKARKNVGKINEARQEFLGGADKKASPEEEEEEDLQEVGEALATLQEMHDLGTSAGNEFSPEEREDMLNADQRKVYDRVKNHLLHQMEHECGQCQCLETLQPLVIFVSGLGGTGKSFLIKAIKGITDSVWEEVDDLKCVITAPMGLASFNVEGVQRVSTTAKPLTPNLPSKEDSVQRVNNFKKSLVLPPQKLREIEQLTRDQSQNVLWHSVRRYRFTASYFGQVYRLKDTTSPENLVLQIIGSNRFTS